jgi:hypothetical protein
MIDAGEQIAVPPRCCRQCEQCWNASADRVLADVISGTRCFTKYGLGRKVNGIVVLIPRKLKRVSYVLVYNYEKITYKITDFHLHTSETMI